jgi:hypothetical protein
VVLNAIFGVDQMSRNPLTSEPVGTKKPNHRPECPPLAKATFSARSSIFLAFGATLGPRRAR